VRCASVRYIATAMRGLCRPCRWQEPASREEVGKRMYLEGLIARSAAVRRGAVARSAVAPAPVRALPDLRSLGC
jgi:hypothetical protein